MFLPATARALTGRGGLQTARRDEVAPLCLCVFAYFSLARLCRAPSGDLQTAPPSYYKPPFPSSPRMNPRPRRNKLPSLAAPSLAAALVFAFTLALLVPAPHARAAAASETPGALTITKQTFTASPTGLQMGFFNGNNDADVAVDFGKRTMCRSVSALWKNLEPKKGVYNFNFPGFASVKRACEFGQTPNIGLGISFDQCVPPFYSGVLKNPETQKAASNFIYALTQYLLKNIGPCNLIIDGEVITALPITDQNKDLWAKWYVELAQAARKAAADLGMPGQIKIMPVLNGNPFRHRILQQGVASNKWITQVLAASDYMGIDTYFYDPSKGVTDPEYTIKILQFWITNYGGNKDVIVQEHGFSTALGLKPNLKTTQAGTKYGGTELQQAEYFKNFCAALQKADQPGGPLRNRLRGFMVYYYKDGQTRSAAIPDDMFWKQHFGVVRADGAKKPAFAALREGYRMIQDDPVLNPVKLASAEEVTNKFPVSLLYKYGTDYDRLHCECEYRHESETPGACVLSVKTASAGTLLVCINGKDWIVDASAGAGGKERRVDVTKHILKGKTNTLDLYFPGQKWPFTQEVLSIKLIQK